MYRQPVLYVGGLLLVILAVAAANVPFAVSRMIPQRIGMPGTATRLAAPAAPTEWPSATPHDMAWPAPQTWTELRSFGVRWYDVRSGTFSMNVRHYGWPLAVLEQKQMWWDWNDPALAGAAPDPPLRLLLGGLVLNPLLVGVPVFLLVAVPLMAIGVARHVWRRHGGQCPECGYDLQRRPEEGCPECGWNRQPGEPD